VISPGVYIGPEAEVEDSIIMHGTQIGAGCRIRRVLIDKNVAITPGKSVGYDTDQDSQHFMLSETGIVLIPKDFKLL